MSETSIANMALGRLGIGQAIADLDEQSGPARICARFYHACRKEVLRAFPWPFAQKAAALAAVSDEEFPGWQYIYQYPNECLMLWCVGDESGIRYAKEYANHCYAMGDVTAWSTFARRQPFQLMNREDGGTTGILSDVPTAWGFYTGDVENPGTFAPDFESVLAWRLAMEIGGPLQAKMELIDRAENKFFAWYSRATAQAFNESGDDPQQASDSITCRM